MLLLKVVACKLIDREASIKRVANPPYLKRVRQVDNYRDGIRDDDDGRNDVCVRGGGGGGGSDGCSLLIPGRLEITGLHSLPHQKLSV